MGVSLDAAVDELGDLLFPKAMVVREAHCPVDFCTELAQSVFKTLRHRDSGQRTAIFATKGVERQALTGVDVLKVHGAVPALDDFGDGVVTADLLDDFFAVSI